jgi:hypothetical protein
MLNPDSDEAEKQRIDAILDAGAEQLAEVLVMQWEYEEEQRRKKKRRSTPLGA